MGGEVNVAFKVGDKNVIVSATRFHGQLTGEVRSRGIVAGNSADERGSLRRWGQGSPRGTGWKTEERRVQGRVGRVGFWRSGGFS